MDRIFVCAPFTPKGYNVKDTEYLYYRDQFIEKANNVGKKLILKGYTPVIPHNLFPNWEFDDNLKNIDHSKWVDHTINIMMLCQKIILLPGWETAEGCKREFNMWQSVCGNKNIYYSIEDVK